MEPIPVTKLLLQVGLAAGATLAFFYSPFFDFADGSRLFWCGLLISILVGLGVGAAPAVKTKRHFYIYLSVLFPPLYAILFFGIAAPAKEAAAVNDLRCSTIQSDMLSAKPRIASGPELYIALHCAPSGDDPTIYVSPTRRELTAYRQSLARTDKH